jgi:hypothetical protein
MIVNATQLWNPSPTVELMVTNPSCQTSGPLSGMIIMISGMISGMISVYTKIGYNIGNDISTYKIRYDIGHDMQIFNIYLSYSFAVFFFVNRKTGWCGAWQWPWKNFKCLGMKGLIDITPIRHVSEGSGVGSKIFSRSRRNNGYWSKILQIIAPIISLYNTGPNLRR